MKTVYKIFIMMGCLPGILSGCINQQETIHVEQNDKVNGQLSPSSTPISTREPLGDAEKFAIIDLGTLGGKRIWPHAINNLSQVVGEAETNDNVFHAFLWQKGKITDLGAYPDDFSVVPHAAPISVSSPAASSAVSINDNSQVVGQSEPSGEMQGGSFLYHAVIWENGQIGDLGVLLYSSSTAIKINDQGQIIGNVIEEDQLPLTREYRTKPFLFQNRQLRLLNLTPESTSINNKGEIIGSPLGSQHFLVIEANGKQKRLSGLIIHKHIFRTAINDNEQAIMVETDCADESPDGYSMFPAYSTWWRHGKTGRLAGLKEYYIAEAKDINNYGEIVGDVRQGYTGQDVIPSLAVLWQNGNPVDLNREIIGSTGWLLQHAEGINNKGEIIGSGQWNGAEHAFLLTPVSRH